MGIQPVKSTATIIQLTKVSFRGLALFGLILKSLLVKQKWSVYVAGLL